MINPSRPLSAPDRKFSLREGGSKRLHLVTQEWSREKSSDPSKSPITSPVSGFKHAISRTGFSTLISRGIHGYRETRDKPRTPLPQENKPETGSYRKRFSKIYSYNFYRIPVCEREGPPRTPPETKPCRPIRGFSDQTNREKLIQDPKQAFARP